MSWIKLHRSLLNSPLWQDKPFARGQAWVDILLLTNGIDRQELKRGRIVLYERGEAYRSVTELAERWGWSRKKVTAFLKMLEGEGMLALETTAHGSKITVRNWERYQNENPKNGTAKNSRETQTGSASAPDENAAGEQPRNSSGTAGEQPRNTKKNVTEKVENVIEPTTQQTTGMIVGTTGAGEVGRCVGGEASAVPSALDAEVAENRYRYGEAIALYEKIKGAPMSPTELDRLTDMVDEYGVEWVLDALKITSQTEGCRSRIGYTQGILRNWKQNGRDDVPGLMSQEERRSEILRLMEEADKRAEARGY